MSYPSAAMLPVFAVLQVLLCAALIGLILMHSGRTQASAAWASRRTSQGGTHIVERNLTRVTAVVAMLFFLNSIVLFRLLK